MERFSGGHDYVWLVCSLYATLFNGGQELTEERLLRLYKLDFVMAETLFLLGKLDRFSSYSLACSVGMFISVFRCQLNYFLSRSISISQGAIGTLHGNTHKNVEPLGWHHNYANVLIS